MPRKAKPRKSGAFTIENVENARAFVKDGGKIREAAKLYGIPKSTLQRFVKNPSQKLHDYKALQIFTTEEEIILRDYVAKCAKMAYGLTSFKVMELAYEMAAINKKKIPSSWERDKRAGSDWCRAFRKRNNLSIRAPEPSSLSRMTSFNRHNVSQFFTNLKLILEKFPELADPSRIYNLDECTTTVQNPKKVVTDKGIKQVSACVSGERGILVTTCAIIRATGTFLPPVLIFPRVHFKEHMLNNGPPSALGLASPSGWMTSELFVKVMDHFILQTNSSPLNRILLIYDNLEAHISIEVISKATLGRYRLSNRAS